VSAGTAIALSVSVLIAALMVIALLFPERF
jgi:hypothetical protein